GSARRPSCRTRRPSPRPRTPSPPRATRGRARSRTRKVRGCRADASGTPTSVWSWVRGGGERNAKPAANAVGGRTGRERGLVVDSDRDRRQAHLFVGWYDEPQDRGEPRPRVGLQGDGVAE